LGAPDGGNKDAAASRAIVACGRDIAGRRSRRGAGRARGCRNLEKISVRFLFKKAGAPAG